MGVSSDEPIIQPEWILTPEPEPHSDAMRWLHQAQRFSLVRAHISVFAVGSVVLLSLNLLLGSSNVWASTWIGAWGTLVLMHGVLAVIATLTIQLFAEDEAVRPATEVSWEPASTWGETQSPPPSHESPAPTPANDLWQAKPPQPSNEDRVSWKAASDAAWLNRAPGAVDADASSSTDHDADETSRKQESS